jgi:hypothetical protein
MTLGSLGRLGQVYARPTRRPPNILRQTFTSGIVWSGRALSGLGQAAGDLLDPWAADAAGENAIMQQVESGAISPELGQSVPTPDMPTVADAPWMQQTIDLPGTRFDDTWLAKKGTLAGIGVLALLSGGISAYHGYRRDRGSWGSAFGWFVLGSMFPVVVPAAAFLIKPGFAKPRRGR